MTQMSSLWRGLGTSVRKRYLQAECCLGALCAPVIAPVSGPFLATLGAGVLQLAPALLLGQRAGHAGPRDPRDPRDPKEKLRVERSHVYERDRLSPAHRSDQPAVRAERDTKATVAQLEGLDARGPVPKPERKTPLLDCRVGEARPVAVSPWLDSVWATSLRGRSYSSSRKPPAAVSTCRMASLPLCSRPGGRSASSSLLPSSNQCSGAATASGAGGSGTPPGPPLNVSGETAGCCPTPGRVQSHTPSGKAICIRAHCSGVKVIGG